MQGGCCRIPRCPSTVNLGRLGSSGAWRKRRSHSSPPSISTQEDRKAASRPLRGWASPSRRTPVCSPSTAVPVDPPVPCLGPIQRNARQLRGDWIAPRCRSSRPPPAAPTIWVSSDATCSSVVLASRRLVAIAGFIPVSRLSPPRSLPCSRARAFVNSSSRNRPRPLPM